MLKLGLGFVGLPSTLQLRGTGISPRAGGKAFSLFGASLVAGIAVLGRLVDAGLDNLVLASAGVGLPLVAAATVGVGSGSAR